MALNFEPVTLNRQKEYRELLTGSRWEASDYSFTNLWTWCSEYGLTWAWEDDIVWIHQKEPVSVYWAPVGRWENVDWEERLQRHFSGPARFTRVPEPLVKLWKDALPDRVSAQAAEDHWDYLYSVEELIALKGNRFHKKKNLLNQFLKSYEHEYKPITLDCIEETIGMQESWCTWRDCESDKTLAAENQAIERVLIHWEELEGLFGGAVYVDDKMVAFTVAEAQNDETIIIHFEKGLVDYKGVYQAINQMFLAENAAYKVVNREQDMGEEGLRKAKRSYNPIDYVRKFKVTLS